jgi:hypothetical protein
MVNPLSGRVTEDLQSHGISAFHEHPQEYDETIGKQLLTGRPLRHHLMGLKGLTAPFNWPQVLLSFNPSAFAHLSQHIGKAGPAEVGKCH